MTVTRRAPCAISVLGIAISPTWAQEWPAKQPIRIIVPYRLKQRVQFDRIEAEHPIHIPGVRARMHGLKTSIFLAVKGAAHSLSAHADNLDITTSAALRTTESMAESS